MIDILKITSPITAADKVKNLTKQSPSDTVFDLDSPNTIVKIPAEGKADEKEISLQKPLLNLNKELLKPLLYKTGTQSDLFRQLLLMVGQFQALSGQTSDVEFDRLFIKPEALLNELLAKDEGKTVFNGAFFDNLRMLAKIDGQPKLQEAIAAILKSFDCFVSRDRSLEAILHLSRNLDHMLFKKDGVLVEKQMNQLENLIQSGALNQKEISAFLKNDYIPLLSSLVSTYQQKASLRNQVMAIIHHIVRYDKGDPARLEEAAEKFGNEIKAYMNLADDEVEEMKSILFKEANERLDKNYKHNTDKMNDILTMAMDQGAPAKMNHTALNLLNNLIQSESPIASILHFMIPVRYQDENTCCEFYIDKDSSGKKGKGKATADIFFTIQTDRYGTFEVDLLANEDRKIDLEIRCSEKMVVAVKEAEIRMKAIIENQGYRLKNFQVDNLKESETILQRFPKLSLGKAGIDVKV